MSVNRRKQPILRFFLWFVSPLDERLRGLSLSRLLAISCFALVAHEVVVHEKSITGWDYATLCLGVICSFGKRMVYAWVTHTAARPKDMPTEGP